MLMEMAMAMAGCIILAGFTKSVSSSKRAVRMAQPSVPRWRIAARSRPSGAGQLGGGQSIGKRRQQQPAGAVGRPSGG
ncbi:hypothetical protein GUJ93_ZPchr0007g6128 [Zizania palustris]|uniref:Secreted protein n=1 Tax=Zizania palustris TaxID=103762 RepID=A0A8J5SZZ5_ZIZPA|nr:hypothetical protein GUJ93_ZPchr0007g6128 [Zizania palustris]